VTSGTYISHLQRVFKSTGVTVSHFFSMLPSTLKYLYSVEPVIMHFPAKQPCTNDAVCNGIRHPQHTQTGSNSSTIAADSSNGGTNTRCCRYSCMRSWWWVEVPPETCRVVSIYK
jgi:hypothetical protein